MGWKTRLILPCLLLAALLPPGCHLETEVGRTLLSVESDTALLKYDRVLILLRDAGGTDTLFAGKLANLDTLSRLPAMDYGGGQAQIILQGYQGGQLVYDERRDYDGTTGRAVVAVVLDPARPTNATGSLDIRPDAIRLFVGGESFQTTAGPVETWRDKPLAWTTGEPSVATVSQTGMLTPVGPGSTYVRATSGDTAQDASAVTVVRDVPVLDVGAADSSCAAGSTISYRVKVTQEYGFIASLAWDLDGDGAYEDSTAGAIGQSVFTTPGRTYTSVREYQIRFRARDGEGNVGSASRKLVVSGSAPRIDSLAALPAVISIRDSVVFSARATGAGALLAAYAWDFNGDGVDDASGSLQGESATVRGGFRFPTPESFQASLRVTDAGGSAVTAKAGVLVKLDRPSVEAGANLVVFPGAQVRLQGRAVDTLGRIVRHEWKIGASAFSVSDSGAASFAAPATPGDVLCIYRATDDDSLAADDTLKVTVNDVQGPAFVSVSPSDTTVSIGDSVEFVARVEAGDADLRAYTMDLDGDGTPDRQGLLAGRSSMIRGGNRYRVPASYNVEIKGEDLAGKVATAHVRVLVKLDRPVADAGRDTAVDHGARVQLRGRAFDTLGRVIAREWKVGTGAFTAVSGGDTSFTAPSAAGKVTCIFRVTDDDALTAEDTMTVTVRPSSDASLASLDLSEGDLDPGFTTAVTNYTAWVHYPRDFTTVTATLASPGAAMTINGRAWNSGEVSFPILLDVGSTDIQVEVTAEDGLARKVYKVTVTRRPMPNTTLSSIILTPSAFPLVPEFSPEEKFYEVTLPATLTSMTLYVVALDPTSSLKLSSVPVGLGSFISNIDVLSARITYSITVTALDGETSTTYFLTLIPQAATQ